MSREVDHLGGAEGRAKELHAGFGELVRLVEQGDVDTRQ